MVASINYMNVQDFSWSRQDVSAVVDLDSYNGQSPVTIRPIQVSPNSCGGYVQCSMYPTCQTFRILSGGSMFNAYFSWSKAILGPWLWKNLHFWWPSLSLLRIFYIYNASTQYCYRVTIGQLIEDLSEISGNLLEKVPEMQKKHHELQTFLWNCWISGCQVWLEVQRKPQMAFERWELDHIRLVGCCWYAQQTCSFWKRSFFLATQVS